MVTRFVVLLLLSSFSLLAQDRSTYRWYFGNNAGVNFNTTPPSILTDGESTHREGTAVVCDTATGNLLFYTDGNTVWNRYHSVMARNLHPQTSSSTQAALILRQPGSERYYHLFTTAANKDASGARHSIIDMTLNNGLGAVISTVQLIDTIVCEKVTAVGSSGESGYWVVFRLYDSDEFYSYRLTTSGLNTTPVVSHTGHRTLGIIGEMSISPNGNILVAASEFDHTFDIFDFDLNCGIVAHPRIIHTRDDKLLPYGVCFSPNGRWLYTTTLPTSSIVRYNLLAADIESSYEELPLAKKYYGQIELAPDGKMYVAYDFGSLTSINNPDSPAPGYTDISIDVGGSSFIGLPNFPRIIKTLRADSSMSLHNDTICPGVSVRIGNAPQPGYSYAWEPANLVDNPTSSQPLAKPFQTTTFQVKVSSLGGCTRTYSLTIYVEKSLPLRVVSFPPADGDTLRLCRGLTATLTASGSPFSYQWNTGETTPTISINRSGVYIVQTQNDSSGCVTRDTVIALLYDVPKADAGKDTTICAGMPIRFRAKGGGEYRWRGIGNAPPLDADTIATPLFVSQKEGLFEYSVRVASAYGCYDYDTLRVRVLPATVADAGKDTSICRGSIVRLSAKKGEAEYLWTALNGAPALKGENTDSPEFDAQQDGNYSYSLRTSNGGGCYSHDTLHISVSAPPIADAGKDRIICMGTTLQLSVSGGSEYLWQELGTAPPMQRKTTNAPSFFSPQEGVFEYSLRVGNTKGCYVYDTLRISVVASIPVHVEDVVMCQGEYKELIVENAQPTIAYEWRDKSGQVIGIKDTLRISPLQSTSYIVHARASDCEGWDTVKISVHPFPSVTTNDVALCLGESAELSVNNEQPGIRYQWRDEKDNVVANSGSIQISPQRSTQYIIVATNAEGCKAYDTAQVIVEKVQIRLSIAPNTEMETGSNTQIVVYGEASREAEFFIEYTVRTKATALELQNGLYENDQVYLRRKQRIHLQKQPAAIDSIPGIVLFSPEKENSVEITDVVIVGDTTCLAIQTTNGAIVTTAPVCGDKQRAFRIGELLSLAPNPANGDVLIQSEYDIDNLSLTTAMGEELFMPERIEGRQSKIIHLNTENYAAGLYFVRVHLAATNVWVTKSLMIVR